MTNSRQIQVTEYLNTFLIMVYIPSRIKNR